jgi:hypothetical protein
MRAMEIRRAETLAPETHEVADPAVAGDGRVVAALTPARSAASLSRRVIARPVALSRERELAFIRTDLHRLAITAGALFVVMIVLLVVVES